MLFAKIDAEVDTVAKEKHSIQGYPSLVLLDSTGKEIDRIGGFLPPEQFIATINNYLQGVGTLDYFLSAADTGATPEVNFAIAEKYGDRGMFDKAEEYFQKVIRENKNNEGGYTSGAMMALADISLRLDEYDEAIARYKMVRKKFPDSITVNDADIYIAIAHRLKGDTATAIQAFEDFLKNHPNSPDTSYALGQIDRLKNPPPPEEEE
jgi:tetratricopeptide (TPR) repeat protein